MQTFNFQCLHWGQRSHISFQMVDDVFLKTSNPQVCKATLFFFSRIFEQKFVEWTIFSSVAENRSFLLWDLTNHIMELHQNAPVSNCKDLHFLWANLLFHQMLFNQHKQELAAAAIDILPALSFVTLILTNSFAFFICHLFPSSKWTTLKNSSSFLSDEFGECNWYFLKIFGLGLDLLESGNCSAKVWDVDLMEANRISSKVDSNFLSLFLTKLG